MDLVAGITREIAALYPSPAELAFSRAKYQKKGAFDEQAVTWASGANARIEGGWWLSPGLAKEAGFDNHLVKPAERDQLQAIFSQLADAAP